MIQRSLIFISILSFPLAPLVVAYCSNTFWSNTIYSLYLLCMYTYIHKIGTCRTLIIKFVYKMNFLDYFDLTMVLNPFWFLTTNFNRYRTNT